MDRGKLRRWSVASSAIGTVVLLSFCYLAPGASSRWMAAIIIAAGVSAAIPAIWSMLTRGRATWDLEVRQVRGVMKGAGILMLGIALLLISMVDLRGRTWDVVAMVTASTFVALYGAARFLLLTGFIRADRARLQQDGNGAT